ncbi:MAG: hypothetical protein M3O25_08490 [Actinomycetota bacterium]|nr:hypothetical protein [Actinomycetota bacterium]
MTREQAERRRNELAREHPGVTWIAAESDGEWRVVRIGVPPANPLTGTGVEARPRPDAADTRPAPEKQVNPNWGF